MALFPQDGDGPLKTFARGVLAALVIGALLLAIACMGKYLGS